MIHFNELRIAEDNKYLIIDVSVDSDPCFSDVTLDTIIVDNQDTYIDNGPSSNPILSISSETGDGKNMRAIIKLDDYSIKSTDMLFIYVMTEGTPSCNVDKSYILGTVVNLYYIYARAMNYIKEIECDCSTPKHFVNFILKLKAMELCIKTGNYTQAIKYWNKLNNNLPNECCYG